MPNAIFVPDIVEANGKTVRQNNLEIAHTIPLKTFVEIDSDYNESHGCRGYVVDYERDCDGTPLYGLSLDPTDAEHIANMRRGVDEKLDQAEAWLKLARSRVNGGWGEDSLIILATPDNRASACQKVKEVLESFPVLAGKITDRQCEMVTNTIVAMLQGKEENDRGKD